MPKLPKIAEIENQNLCNTEEQRKRRRTEIYRGSTRMSPDQAEFARRGAAIGTARVQTFFSRSCRDLLDSRTRLASFFYDLRKRRLPFLTEPPLHLFPKPRCVLVFVSGKNAEQVAVDQRAERLGAVAIIAQAGGRKDRRPF